MRLLLLGLTLLLAGAAAAPAQDRIPDARPLTAARSWRLWWEFNREVCAPFRAQPRPRVALGGRLDTVRAALRRRAVGGDQASRSQRRVAIVESGLGDKPRMRVAAIVALGRLGDDRDVPLLLAMLENPDERSIVKQACALALAARPPVEDGEVRDALRKKLIFWLRARRDVFRKREPYAYATPRKVQPSVTHQLILVTAGIRAREDDLLLAPLIAAAKRPAKTTQLFVAALALACGLTDSPMLLPELSQAVRKGRFGGKTLNDVSRSDATYALGRLGATGASVLVEVLQAKKTGLETRRAAALGLARILRGGLDGPVARAAEQALAAELWRKGRPVLGGLAAIALGNARNPLRIDELWRALDEAPDAERKPYVALALGLAARNAPTHVVDTLRSRLAEALRRARGHELEAALCLACGLARARDALPLLTKRAARRSERMVIRAAAAQGLGLLGVDAPAARRALLAALESGELELVEDAAVALSMLGDKEVGARLVGMLGAAKGSRSRSALRVAYAQALGRLREPTAAGPLRRILEDWQADPRSREAAAAALGWITGRSESDPLTELHHDLNFHARTLTTQDLTRLCGAYVTVTRPKTERKR